MCYLYLKIEAAARKLGCANNTVVKYRRDGAPDYIGLACAALAFGLPHWKKGNSDD